MQNIINKSLDFGDCRLVTKMDEANSGKMIIKGYANVAKVDRVNEIMPKACWDLKNYRKNPTICLDHRSYDSNYLVGKAIEVDAKEEGLYFEAEIGDESKGELTPSQKLARSLINQGYLIALSVGFKAIDYDYDTKSDTIIYKKAELHEISLVTVPCQQDSFITSIKSLESRAKIENASDNRIKEIDDKLTELNSKLLSLQTNTDLKFKNVFIRMLNIVKLPN